jgi:hypothetical protein
VGDARGIYWGEETSIQDFGGETQRGTDHLQNLAADETIKGKVFLFLSMP